MRRLIASWVVLSLYAGYAVGTEERGTSVDGPSHTMFFSFPS